MATTDENIPEGYHRLYESISYEKAKTDAWAGGGYVGDFLCRVFTVFARLFYCFGFVSPSIPAITLRLLAV